MTSSHNIMSVIEAALDVDLDDEYLIDHIASHLRPKPWTLAEERLGLW